jgi:hypothetical protein
LEKVIDLLHVALKMTEEYTSTRRLFVLSNRTNVRRRKKKVILVTKIITNDEGKEEEVTQEEVVEEHSDNEEEDEEIGGGGRTKASLRQEREFSLSKYLRRFASGAVVKGLVPLMRNFESNRPETNSRLATLLHRIAFSCDAYPLFFQVSIFQLFERILSNEDFVQRSASSASTSSSSSSADEHGETSLPGLATRIMERFLKCGYRQPSVFIEALFNKQVSDCGHLLDPEEQEKKYRLKSEEASRKKKTTKGGRGHKVEELDESSLGIVEDPDGSKAPWSEEDDENLLKNFEMYRDSKHVFDLVAAMLLPSTKSEEEDEEVRMRTATEVAIRLSRLGKLTMMALREQFPSAVQVLTEKVRTNEKGEITGNKKKRRTRKAATRKRRTRSQGEEDEEELKQPEEEEEVSEELAEERKQEKRKKKAEREAEEKLQKEQNRKRSLELIRKERRRSRGEVEEEEVEMEVNTVAPGEEAEEETKTREPRRKRVRFSTEIKVSNFNPEKEEAPVQTPERRARLKKRQEEEEITSVEDLVMYDEEEEKQEEEEEVKELPESVAEELPTISSEEEEEEKRKRVAMARKKMYDDLELETLVVLEEEEEEQIE